MTNNTSTIKISTNYEEFSYLDGNRPVDNDHKNLLKRLIQQKNHLSLQPLTIGLLPDNRKVIIDGQHRFQVSQELGLGIHYLEIRCSSEAEARELASLLNAGKKAWHIGNHVDMHAANGNTSYQRLLDLCSETEYDLRNILTILNEGKRKGPSTLQEIKLGNLHLDDDMIEKVRESVRKVKQVSDTIQERWTSQGKKVNFLKSSAFVMATLRLIKTPGLNFSNMLEKLNAEDVIKQTSTDGYIARYENIYNSKKSKHRVKISRI